MAQTFEGTAGNDSLTGSDGDDEIYGYDGNDTLQGGAGSDILYGGAGNDLVQGGSGNDVFVRIFYSLGDDTLDGGDGDDYFSDDYGSNQFIGGPGLDHFYVYGETGTSQTARGDAGADVYQVSASFEARTYAITDFTAGAGGDQLEVAELLMFESYAFGYGGTNPFAPAQLFLRFTQSGPDALLQWDPDGTAHGAYGWITQLALRGVTASALTTANLVGAIPIDGSAMPVYSLTGTDDAENVIGGVFDDHLAGLAGDDYMVGWGGRDLIDGGAGNDIMLGDVGNDTLIGGAGNDSLDGGGGDNSLKGGDGADRFHVGEGGGYLAGDVSRAGTTSVIGGAGADIMSIFRPSSGTAHSWLDFDAPGGDQVNLESLVELSAGLGYAGGNPFAAAAGFLRITQQGADALVQWDPDGAAGTTHGWLTALVLKGTVASTITASNIVGNLDPAGGDGVGQTITGTAAADTLSGTAYADQIGGLAGNDSINGSSGDDLINGGADNDWLEGGLGHDTLAGDSGNDSLDGGMGNDWLQGGDGNDQFTDRYGNNTLDGGAGDDVFTYIAFDGGAFTLTGGAGRDKYFVHGPNGAPVALVTDFAAGDGGDLLEIHALISASMADGSYIAQDPFLAGFIRPLQSGADVFLQWDRDGATGSAYDWEACLILQGVSATAMTRDNFGGQVLVGSAGNDVLIGTFGDDTLQGLAGDDVLDGAGGNDLMEGGSGNDTYYVDATGDLVAEPDPLLAVPPDALGTVNVGSNIDRVVASISYTLTSFVENLALAQGGGALAGTGNSANNLIEGNESNNVLSGEAGNDTLQGGAGIDAARFAGTMAQHTLGHEAQAITVTSAALGSDVLLGVERLLFSDAKLALDLDGNAGVVAKLLGSVFGADAVGNQGYAGIGLSFLDGGTSVEALVQLAIDFRLGAGASNEDLVSLLYGNVVGGAPTQDQLHFYAGLIADGAYTQETLTLFAADVSLNLANIGWDALVANGLLYS